MKQLLLWLPSYLNFDTIIGKALSMTQSAIKASIVLLAFYLLHRLVKRVLGRVIEELELETTIASFLKLVINYTIGIFGVVTALDQIGVDVGSLIAGLGIAGIALGFAAKDTLSNIVAGVFIFWDRPFSIGDLVEIQGEYGEVQTITLRTTRIITPDGKTVSIPNQMIAANKVISYTMFPHLRLDIPVTIGVTESIEQARQVILQVVEGDTRYLPDRPPVVLVTKLGDYFTELQLRVWLDDGKQHVGVRAELREKMKNALDAAGIEMPYEKLEVFNYRKDVPKM